MTARPGVDPFDADAATGAGYVYTTQKRLSSQLALARHLELILALGRLGGRSVLDIGCGDGFSTIQFWDAAGPSKLAGVDPAANAIRVANRNRGSRPIDFEAADGHNLPYPDDSFDLALIQGVLHHDDEPRASIREALRVAREVVILEPNGLNPGLKVIEKVSPYHRRHHERSYPRRRLRRWIEAAGGRVEEERFAVFVPMFCPDWMAKLMKRLEPLVERTPGLRSLCCAVYVLRACR
jgi:SAM-dependent methyltransferase